MWGGCWKIQWEGMCLVLKQWSWSCFEKLSSCFYREWDENMHPNRKWGFLEGLFLKEEKRNCRAELLLLVKMLIHLPDICSLISSMYWLLHESKLHTDLDQVCLIWFGERGIHLQLQFGQIFWTCATNQDFDSSCSYLGRVSRVSQVDQRNSQCEGSELFCWRVGIKIALASSHQSLVCVVLYYCCFQT